MNLATLAPFPGSRHRSKRVGCGEGSGHGGSATRGMKGQRSRAGDGKLIGFEGGQMPLLRRIPKRGFSNRAFRTRHQIVRLKDIARVFTSQEDVSLEALRMHGLLRGKAPVKVLSDGEVGRPYRVEAHAFSKKAEARLSAAGGKALKPA